YSPHFTWMWSEDFLFQNISHIVDKLPIVVLQFLSTQMHLTGMGFRLFLVGFSELRCNLGCYASDCSDFYIYIRGKATVIIQAVAFLFLKKVGNTDYNLHL